MCTAAAAVALSNASSHQLATCTFNQPGSADTSNSSLKYVKVSTEFLKTLSRCFGIGNSTAGHFGKKDYGQDKPT